MLTKSQEININYTNINIIMVIK